MEVCMIKSRLRAREFDGATLIHANAYHMATAIEPVAEAITRIAAAGSKVSSVKRI